MTGQALKLNELQEHHYDKVFKFQKLCFIQFPQTLKELALTHVGRLEEKDTLLGFFSPLETDILHQVCHAAGIRIRRLGTTLNASESNFYYENSFLVSCLIKEFKKRPSEIDRINRMSLLPDEVRD